MSYFAAPPSPSPTIRSLSHTSIPFSKNFSSLNTVFITMQSRAPRPTFLSSSLHSCVVYLFIKIPSPDLVRGRQSKLIVSPLSVRVLMSSPDHLTTNPATVSSPVSLASITRFATSRTSRHDPRLGFRHRCSYSFFIPSCSHPPTHPPTPSHLSTLVSRREYETFEGCSANRKHSKDTTTRKMLGKVLRTSPQTSFPTLTPLP